MSFGALNIDVALQISNKILFEESFGDALIKYYKCVKDLNIYCVAILVVKTFIIITWKLT